MIKKTKRDSKSDDRLAIRKSVVMELSPAQMARVYGGEGGGDPETITLTQTTSTICITTVESQKQDPTRTHNE